MKTLTLVAVSAVVGVMAVGAALWISADVSAAPRESGAGVSMAVMGDSNTHSYQDSISFPAGSGQRGGPFHDRTFQWTEVLARLRGNELDSGPWLRWGVSNPLLRAMDIAGSQVGRAPRKEDYQYNFANDGAQCAQLMGTHVRQAPRLVALMNKKPQRWTRGVVVIRIGMADFSAPDFIDQLAQDPEAPPVRARLSACVDDIRQAVMLIRDSHPTVRIVLVGIFNDAHDPLNFDKWRSREALRNISKGFDQFDGDLRKLAASGPYLSFFDDRAWFRQRWGSRGAQGEPAYQTVAVGPLKVTNTIGDAPTHALLADDHAGLVWNVLWAQAMSKHLHEVVGLPVTPISDTELARFVGSLTAPATKAPGS